MITVPIRDRLRSEDERLFIASLELGHQQIFASESEDNPNPKHCDICQYKFKSQQDISSHRVHHEMNLHFCRLGCGIWLDTLEKILEHEYRQHFQPGRVLCCRVCDFMANSADDLASHMQKHIYVYRFVCSICRRHFESKQSLNLHRKQSQDFCSLLDFRKGSSSKPELVAVSTPVPEESNCYVQIKEEPLNAEEADRMLLEDNPPLNVKLEPQDEEMPDVSRIKEEQSNGSVWTAIHTPLRNKLRLPALATTKNQMHLKPGVKRNGLLTSNVESLNKKSNHSVISDDANIPISNQEPSNSSIAANILKVLPSNCMVIKLPPNTKIFKTPGQAPAAPKDSPTVTLSGTENSTNFIKIPKTISISTVGSMGNPHASAKTVQPTQTHSRSSCFLVDSFNNSKSRPESMKIINEFRNQIRSIEKTLPLPGTVLQSSKVTMDESTSSPMDAPKPVELMLNPSALMVARELEIQYPLYRFMWTCPLCQRMFEKHCAFRAHLTNKHDLTDEKCNVLKVVLMPSKILSQDSANAATQRVHVPLNPQTPVPPPELPNTVNLPLLLSKTSAPLTGQTSALSNVPVNKGLSPTSINIEKPKVSKKPKKNQSFQCTECLKVFTTFGALRIHKSIHTGELPYQCSYCDKRFRTPGQVRVHHRRHTGEKPFKCKICSLDFTHRETLISHLSRHIGMKRYKCYGCDKYFVVVSGLRAHRRLRPDTCGKVKFTARAHGPRVRVIRGEVVFQYHPEHNGYLRSEDPLNILSQRDQTNSTPPETAIDTGNAIRN
nr:uncharacterized protein Dmel_CG10462, isoform C [Drosophila melanogaster]NP_001033915.1 uncharacterized protein Dmel_CG10462, isoform B [Drosophila melanogaster]ABC65907.1 uncharacterized protein Dmel_CG10462, isoform B [Drosophila melanogaster]ABC65908.1 uncharacterized protein Dmel_CG10462, isoform C [Drosophila melanogaster]|eukprot:NP_001033914.1 uncharacterized protein Dmel_CG10462, isoform C [Drosophila melanogaster]